MGILKNLNIVNLYQVKSMLKFKINVNLPRLLCIVVSAALNAIITKCILGFSSD